MRTSKPPWSSLKGLPKCEQIRPDIRILNTVSPIHQIILQQGQKAGVCPLFLPITGAESPRKSLSECLQSVHFYCKISSGLQIFREVLYMKKGEYLVEAGSKLNYQVVGSSNGNVVLASNSEQLDEVLILAPEELEGLIAEGKLSRLIKI
jgi:hypothetical protein